MGVLEDNPPAAAVAVSHDMFVLCASGRIVRTKVALVSVGANVASERLTAGCSPPPPGSRATGLTATSLAGRDAAAGSGHQRGPRLSRPRVRPARASAGPGDERTVGIGLMDYHGNNEDHGRPGDIRAGYVEKMKSFTRWLVDNGRRVRLFVGDTNNADQHVVRKTWPTSGRPARSRPGLGRRGTRIDVRGPDAGHGAGRHRRRTRYHNVMCALMLSKPTISIGYGEKNAVLMAGTGLAEYCQSVNSLDVERLIEQFTDLENQAARLRQTITRASGQGAADRAPAQGTVRGALPGAPALSQPLAPCHLSRGGIRAVPIFPAAAERSATRAA